MIRSIADFLTLWQSESESTLKVFRALTDPSLAQEIAPGHRTIGRIAWHITGTPREMLARTGLSVEGPEEHGTPPGSAKAIVDTYARVGPSVADQVRTHWTDAALATVDEMYGEKWTRGFTLQVLVLHQTHHRGELIPLIRQAGLSPPGVYGPSKEDWAQWNMKPPEI